MKNTFKLKVELEEIEEGTSINVEMEGECDPKIAEKVIYCTLDAFHTKAPITTLLAINKFIDKRLG